MKRLDTDQVGFDVFKEDGIVTVELTELETDIILAIGKGTTLVGALTSLGFDAVSKDIDIS